MDKAIAVNLVKEKLGIKSNKRDEYITAIVDGIISELTDEKGLTLDDSPYKLMFVVDYSVHRYEKEPVMPRHLQYRLHNLMAKEAGK